MRRLGSTPAIVSTLLVLVLLATVVVSLSIAVLHGRIVSQQHIVTLLIVMCSFLCIALLVFIAQLFGIRRERNREFALERRRMETKQDVEEEARIKEIIGKVDEKELERIAEEVKQMPDPFRPNKGRSPTPAKTPAKDDDS